MPSAHPTPATRKVGLTAILGPFEGASIGMGDRTPDYTGFERKSRLPTRACAATTARLLPMGLARNARNNAPKIRAAGSRRRLSISPRCRRNANDDPAIRSSP